MKLSEFLFCDGVQPKMSPLILLSRIYQKILLCRNRTNSWYRTHMYFSIFFSTLYRNQVSFPQNIFLIHIYFQMLLLWHLIMICALFWCYTFCSYISFFPVSTHSSKQHHHFLTLPFYYPYTKNTERWSPIPFCLIVVR